MSTQTQVATSHTSSRRTIITSIDDSPKATLRSPEQIQHYDLHGASFEVPSFTMKQIYDAIPNHCFRPSNMRSAAYVVRDLVFTGILLYGAVNIPLISSTPLRALAWSAYAVAQGMVWTGVWILAHECGHGALFTHRWMNNIVGLVLHSFLLVPFHSWRISHAKHHKATGHLQRDMIFIPETKDEFLDRKFGKSFDLNLSHMVEDAPLYSLYKLLEHQFFGMPLYLLFSISAPYKGNGRYPWWKLNHFYLGKDGPIFQAKDVRDVLISDIGIATMLAAIYASAKYFGTWNTFIMYIVPYFFVNHWIVAITYLHHTDGSLPHYADGAWSFPRGASATIDRDFGFIGRHIFHSIIETHVLHHLVSTIPFYKSHEATMAIKGILGKSYRSDTKTNFLMALWRNFRRCQWIEESINGSGVFFFRNLEWEMKRMK
ncbi:hypothetical protein Egran_06835 [Elaphomyces granulatus]|uniref:Fatty acid desaturase domain-containing protein n=1 Tax=Elaphomyces granulatus TaxID=519963 RepID=A0A232LN27_9EURO|nr:hypothetical protein Egran_06835 [Elaphomyces granulatus]